MLPQSQLTNVLQLYLVRFSNCTCSIKHSVNVIRRQNINFFRYIARVADTRVATRAALIQKWLEITRVYMCK